MYSVPSAEHLNVCVKYSSRTTQAFCGVIIFMLIPQFLVCQSPVSLTRGWQVAVVILTNHQPFQGFIVNCPMISNNKCPSRQDSLPSNIQESTNSNEWQWMAGIISSIFYLSLVIVVKPVCNPDSPLSLSPPLPLLFCTSMSSDGSWFAHMNSQ